jgi:hypothetical protein
MRTIVSGSGICIAEKIICFLAVSISAKYGGVDS